MKKILSIMLAAILLFGLFGCGNEKPQATQGTGTFQVGFGKVDITPTEPIHMRSYGDPATHISEGALDQLNAMYKEENP